MPIGLRITSRSNIFRLVLYFYLFWGNSTLLFATVLALFPSICWIQSTQPSSRSVIRRQSTNHPTCRTEMKRWHGFHFPPAIMFLLWKSHLVWWLTEIIKVFGGCIYRKKCNEENNWICSTVYEYLFVHCVFLHFYKYLFCIFVR